AATSTASLLPVVQPPQPPLLPYTTLFRSQAGGAAAARRLARLLRGERARGDADALRARRAGHAARAPPELRRAVHDPRLGDGLRSEEHTARVQYLRDVVYRLLLEKKNGGF